ncbi:3492_t:CDS:2 [Gigaspora rosea]|nr:3492_t:CDS:2 [Gigaspora rosea]
MRVLGPSPVCCFPGCVVYTYWRTAITSCVRCLEAVHRRDALCIPTGVRPLRPALDVWRQSIGVSLGIRVPGLSPVCCFPVYR